MDINEMNQVLKNIPKSFIIVPEQIENEEYLSK